MEYRKGDGGDNGWSSLNEEKGNTVAMTSSLVITNELLGYSTMTYQDFTPLATMASEWQSVIVPADSPIQTIADLMNQLKNDPDANPIGIEPQFGNDDQIAFAQAARSEGIAASQLRFFRYDDAPSLASALQSSEIAAASLSSSQSAKMLTKGEVRILAISSEERLDSMPNVPTWKEQGIDLVFPHWRGVMGPKEMSEEEKRQWSVLLSKVSASSVWKDEMKKNQWTPFYRNSIDTIKLLESDTRKYRHFMNE
nr:tripartite tricarboxylate transporter substrate-binding protein [Domibacillus antri]